MPLSPVPASVASDGNWLIKAVPSSVSNPLSLAALGGASVKDVTYSYTPDGFNYAINQETVNDPRLTLTQNLSRPGKKTETLETKYVRSTDVGSAAQIFTEGWTGSLVIRRGIPNSQALAVGDKVDVITIQSGAKRPDAPAENGVDTFSQTQFITAVTQQEVALVA